MVFLCGWGLDLCTAHFPSVPSMLQEVMEKVSGGGGEQRQGLPMKAKGWGGEQI